jgi:hypothetical protein
LFTTINSASANKTSISEAAVAGAGGWEGGGAAISMRSPRRVATAARAADPLMVTRPALIMRTTWEREYSGAIAAARYWSSRIRGASFRTVRTRAAIASS